MKRTTSNRDKPRTPQMTRGAFLALSRVSLWTATLTVVAFGFYALEARARDLHTRQPCRLEWASLPDWVLQPDQRDLLAEISSTAGLYNDEDLTRGDVCARVAANLAASPWIEHVGRVTKRPGVVRVEAAIRQPLTMVLHQGNAYLVDEKGVRLPRELRADQVDRKAWMVVSGASAPPPRVGELWQGNDLAGGLKLAKTLMARTANGQLSCRPELTTVDVSNFDLRKSPREARIRLLTTNPDCVIQWGVCPGEEYNIECSADEKLSRLDQLARRNNGRLPDLGPIDLRPADRVLFGRASS